MKNIYILLIIGISFNINAQITTIKSVEGVWKSEGYGQIIEIKKRKSYLYDICKINCTKAESVKNKTLLAQYDIFKPNDSTMVVKDGISKYTFKKISKLPDLCSKKKCKTKDPIYNFKVLWQTFKENYCYFKERKIDWDALKLKYISKITIKTKQFELLLIMDSLILELKDGHSNIFVPKKLIKKYRRFVKENQQKRRKKILDSLGQSFKLIPIHVDSTRLLVLNKYVKEVKSYNYGVLNYGLINENVAIVQINGMEQFANYNIPSGLSMAKAGRMYEKNAEKSENYTKDNVKGAAYIMDKVMADIKNTKACIIDLRFNGGGYDEVQLEILKRFATKETVVFTKKAKNGNGFTPKNYVSVKPSDNAYKGKIYILTSHQTASAAEDFTLGTMSAIPTAIRIGSNTEGIFSDLLNKKLPNGWSFSLSNEVYQSPEGKSYEVTGIAPHHKIEYDKKTYWFYRKLYLNKNGKDLAIEKALYLIQN